MPEKQQDVAPISIAAYSEDLVFMDAEVESKPLDLPMMVLAKGILQSPVNLLSWGVCT